MERSNSKLIEVKTKDIHSPKLQVLLNLDNNKVSCRELHSKVCDSLNLTAGSRELFSLFSNLPKKKKIKLNEFLALPVTADITIEKWCFDKGCEKKALQGDPNAVHLIFVQAQHDIQSGKLKPNKEESQALEGVHMPKHQMRPGSSIGVTLSKSGITFSSDTLFSVPWFNLHWWSICPNDLKVTFNISMETALTIAIETKEAVLLVTAVMEFLRLLLKSNSELPPFHSSMVKTTPDGCTIWENSVYGIHL